jgi:predicted acylesterase/phospholipase RssA
MPVMAPKEAHVPIDLIGGSSRGSMIGAAIAQE